MPLPERVAEIKEHRRKVEERVSIEEAGAREVATKAQEQARAANLEAFNKFEQGLDLKKSLEALAEAEGLKSPQIRELVKGSVAEEVELRLQWEGEPKRKYQDFAIVNPSRGFFSISVRWSVAGMVTVSGENVEAVYTPFLEEEENKEDFEDSVAQAYLNPRWTKHYDVIATL